MTVDSFSDKLSAYIDGELPEADRAEIEEMISEIPACSAMFENMMILQERLGNLPELQPSAEFEFGLRSQILLEAAKETHLRHKVKQVLFPTVGRSILSGAVAAMLAMGVTVLLQGDPKNDVSASRVPAEAELVPAGAQLDPAQTIQYYGAVNARSATVPAQSVDRGALKQLSEQESYALARRLYRARTDSPLSKSTTDLRTRPVVQQGKARPVPVSF
jgi:anti-sigma factor RsiW